MLEDQCRAWPLPLVAVIYVPVSGSTVLGSAASTAPTLDVLKQQLAAFHQRLSHQGELQGVIWTEASGEMTAFESATESGCYCPVRHSMNPLLNACACCACLCVPTPS